MEVQTWKLRVLATAAVIVLPFFFGMLAGLVHLGASPEASRVGPKVAILFLIKDHLITPRLWTFWYEEAMKWSGNNGLIAFLHYSNQSLEAVYAGTPDFLHTRFVTAPAKCKWGHTVPCMLRLLEVAFEDSDAESFMFVSGNTIPVKPFSWMYQSLLENPRSRFYFSNVDMPILKHHQWVILNRAHATLLLKNSGKLFDNARWISHRYPNGKGAKAADDEHAIFQTLEELLTRDVLQFQINDAQPLPPFVNKEFTSASKDYQHTWVCWGGGCQIGEGTGGPRTYVEVNSTLFENEIWRKQSIWFARKFHTRTVAVHNDGERIPLAKYVESLFGNDFPLESQWPVGNFSIYEDCLSKG